MNDIKSKFEKLPSFFKDSLIELFTEKKDGIKKELKTFGIICEDKNSDYCLSIQSVSEFDDLLEHLNI